MTSPRPTRPRWIARHGLVPFVAALLCGLVPVGSAQLAITEVMSQASTNLGSQFVPARSDFWELTNFGTNTLALDGYTFSDRDADPAVRVPEPFRNCQIGPGESIIFLRSDTITNQQDFLSWWGAAQLPANLQVRSWPRRPGLDAELDAIQLFDPLGALVARVDFGKAQRGRSFIYDPDTGEFGVFSALGQVHTLRAASTEDQGSPGTTSGPVPLRFREQPADVLGDAGGPVQLSFRADGLPRPRHQWYRDGLPLLGERGPELFLKNARVEDAGSYTVRLDNGLESLTSAVALVRINTNPSPARISVPPEDASVFEGQTAVFTAQVRGYPPPALQWQANGVNIPGATNSSLTLAQASLSQNDTLYTLLAANPSGQTNASARLQVTRPPRLAITEVMAAVNGGGASGHADWFELTNLGTNAVNLRGYRFSDRYSFELTFRITNHVILQPEESIIFVERLSREDFLRWWGQEQLPAGLQVIPYTGLGFSSSGDVINFWNGAETDPFQPVISIGFLEALPGISQRTLAPDYFFITDSSPGLDGTLRAVEGGDLGSPGYLTNPPPRFVSAQAAGHSMALRCRVNEGRAYQIEWQPRLPSGPGSARGSFVATNSLMRVEVERDPGDSGFYLLREQP